jgi:maltose alpha-D-glucosyltransferase/alpha-amylase
MQEVSDYFDNGRRMQLVLNFQANQRLFLALVDEDATQLAESLASVPPLGKLAQWAHFLRNHDELDLGRLTDSERKRAFAALGPDADMQLYERGLRRRLAGMLGGDQTRLHFCYALLLGLPGTPVFWYGEELGMVENLALPERQAVRTPMQWCAGHNAGFSSAATTVKPILAEGPGGSDNVNVAASRRDPNSLLNRIERLIRLRKESPEIGFGDCEVLQVEDKRVLALRYAWRGQTLIVAYNFGREDCRFRLAPSGISAPLTDVFSGEQIQPHEGYAITLRGSGFSWLRVGAQDAGVSVTSTAP